MARHVLSAIAMVACLCAPAAAAPAAGSADGLVAILEGMGRDVSVSEASDGPNIVVGDTDWSISLAGCTDAGVACEYGWIYAPRRLGYPVMIECGNDWNGTQPFGTVWIDNTNQPWLTHTLNLRGDPSAASIESTFVWFEEMLAAFETYIEDCPPVNKNMF